MKKILLGFLFCYLLIGCKSSSAIITSKKEAISKGVYSYDENQNIVISDATKNKNSVKSNTASLPYNIVSTAKENIGVPYKSGGTTKAGMDCSGLIQRTFTTYKIALPRTSSDLANEGFEVSKNKAQPGDLIFFKTNNSKIVNHVGIITNTDGNDIVFIHSSTSKGVIESSLSERYYDNAFEKINRVLE